MLQVNSSFQVRLRSGETKDSSFQFSKFEEVESLLDGFSISSVNAMLYKWDTGEISNTGSEDT